MHLYVSQAYGTSTRKEITVCQIDCFASHCKYRIKADETDETLHLLNITAVLSISPTLRVDHIMSAS